MSIKTMVSCGAFALWSCLATAGALGGGGDAQPRTVSAIGQLDGHGLSQKLAKLIPGKSTKAQVQSLLGAPWRTVQYDDLGVLEDEIWEYRGVDPSGSYRVHIEFDHHDVVHIIGKIPDDARAQTPVRAAPQKSALAAMK
ncbi:MAG TPA: hypothetical protein VME42_14710 [Steroidobacteraceae bacterium]|nr:hypothetical protein [Steroidobacteraceae bacterium]